MKKILFLLSFLITLSLVSASAYAYTISWDLDAAGITGSNYDTNNQTGYFSQMSFYAETTVTQFDDNSNNTLDVGESFVDEGNLIGNGFIPGIDSEGMGSNTGADWEMTGTMSNFSGYVTDINPYGTNANRIDYAYTSGTLELWADGSPDYNHNTRINTDDSGFGDGFKAATFEVVYGTGHTFLDLDNLLGVSTQGSGEFLLEASFLADNFWYDSDGNDLADIYNDVDKPISWLINFTDYNVDDPIVTPGETDDVLFTSQVTHDGSMNFGAVPEPATMILLGFGLLGLAGVSRKKLFK